MIRAMTTADTHSDRLDLVLLHGVAGSREEVAPWCAGFAPHFQPHTLNLCGHGERPLPSALTMAQYRSDLLAQLDALELQAPVLLGYSFGGVVALDFAAHHPNRVTALATLATRWLYDAPNVAHAVHLLEEARLLRLPERVVTLERMHPLNGWQPLAERLREMYRRFAAEAPLSDATLARVRAPSLLITGDADPVAPPSHLMALHHRLPGSTPAVFSGSAHPPAAVPAATIQQALAQWAQRLGPR